VRNQGFTRFAAQVGINDSGQRQAGTVTFEIWGDGRLLGKSPPMAFGTPAAPLQANVAGVGIVELVARAGDGQMVQPATWGEAALIR